MLNRKAKDKKKGELKQTTLIYYIYMHTLTVRDIK